MLHIVGETLFGSNLFDHMAVYYGKLFNETTLSRSTYYGNAAKHRFAFKITLKFDIHSPDPSPAFSPIKHATFFGYKV